MKPSEIEKVLAPLRVMRLLVAAEYEELIDEHEDWSENQPQFVNEDEATEPAFSKNYGIKYKALGKVYRAMKNNLDQYSTTLLGYPDLDFETVRKEIVDDSQKIGKKLDAYIANEKKLKL